MGSLQLGALYRNQWVNVVGAPVTTTAFARSPLSEKMEVGLSFINDEIGEGALKESIYRRLCVQT